MDLTWYGHSCFRVRTKDAVVITDPFNKIKGLDLGRPKARIVTVSHDHPGHNNVAAVRGDPELTVVDGPGEYEISGVFITGIRTYHDSERGRRLGRNTIYLIESEGIVLAHLGDLGHGLSSDQTELFSSVDVLLVPVGGGNSLNYDQAAEVVTQLEPSIVVPMHYRTAQGQDGLESVERFCKQMGLGEWAPEERLTVRKSDLGENTQVKVLMPRSS